MYPLQSRVQLRQRAMDYHNSSYKWKYQDSMQNWSYAMYRQWSSINWKHICQDGKFYSSFSYSHKILCFFDINTILASCMTTQINADFFFLIMLFFHTIVTFDSFICGGKCRRPWHYGRKHCWLNVPICQLAYCWCKIQLIVVPGSLILKRNLEDPHVWPDASHITMPTIRELNHNLSHGLKIHVRIFKRYPIGISVLIWECTGWN